MFGFSVYANPLAYLYLIFNLDIKIVSYSTLRDDYIYIASGRW
jgi:hypothetical protein